MLVVYLGVGRGWCQCWARHVEAAVQRLAVHILAILQWTQRCCEASHDDASLANNTAPKLRFQVALWLSKPRVAYKARAAGSNSEI